MTNIKDDEGDIMRRIIVLVSISALIFICTGCSETKEVEEYAQETVDIVMNGEVQGINQIIFGYQEFEPDKEIAGMFMNEREDGILGEIFKRTSMKVKSIKKDEIVYEIEAPNLRGIFDELVECDIDLSEKEFIECLKKYITQAEIKKVIVSVPYNIIDGEIKGNYQSEEFINAITGGLLEGYQEIYQKMIKEYTEGEKICDE